MKTMLPPGPWIDGFAWGAYVATQAVAVGFKLAGFAYPWWWALSPTLFAVALILLVQGSLALAWCFRRK